jgi:hypothetical protein
VTAPPRPSSRSRWRRRRRTWQANQEQLGHARGRVQQQPGKKIQHATKKLGRGQGQDPEVRRRDQDERGRGRGRQALAVLQLQRHHRLRPARAGGAAPASTPTAVRRAWPPTCPSAASPRSRPSRTWRSRWPRTRSSDLEMDDGHASPPRPRPSAGAEGPRPRAGAQGDRAASHFPPFSFALERTSRMNNAGNPNQALLRRPAGRSCRWWAHGPPSAEVPGKRQQARRSGGRHDRSEHRRQEARRPGGAEATMPPASPRSRTYAYRRPASGSRTSRACPTTRKWAQARRCASPSTCGPAGRPSCTPMAASRPRARSGRPGSGRPAPFKVELVLIDDPVAMRDVPSPAGDLHIGWATVDMLPLLAAKPAEGQPRDAAHLPADRLVQRRRRHRRPRLASRPISDLRGKTVALAQNSPSHYFAAEHADLSACSRPRT